MSHSVKRLPANEPKFKFPPRLRRELVNNDLVPMGKIRTLEWEVDFFNSHTENGREAPRPAEVRATFEQGLEQCLGLVRWMRTVHPDTRSVLAIALGDVFGRNLDYRGVNEHVTLLGQACEAALADHVKYQSRGGRPAEFAPSMMLWRVSRFLRHLGHEIDKRPNGALALVPG